MTVQLYEAKLIDTKKRVEGFLIIYRGEPCIILENENTVITHQGDKGYGPCPDASYVIASSIKPSKTIEI